MKSLYKTAAFIIGLSCCLSACTANSSEAMVEKIEFHQLAQDMQLENVKTEVSVEKNIFEKKLPVYKIVSKKKDANYVKKLLDLFEMTDYKTGPGVYPEGSTEYTQGSKELTVQENGNFVYLVKSNRDDEESVINRRTAVEMSDDEVKEQAQQFLEGTGLLPKEYVVAGKLGYHISGGKTVEKEVAFFQNIDGYSVYGRSDISVSYGYEELRSVYCLYSDYELDMVASTKSYNQAVDMVKSVEAGIDFEGSAINGQEKIIIDECEIAYYEYAPTGTDGHIQPIYSFIGKIYDKSGESTEFSSMVPALTDEYVKN